MVTPLVVTKITVPPQREQRLLRPRLEARLLEGLSQNLTLVSSPAGFGKTTLLCEFAVNCESPVAWFAIDAEDDDVTRFMSYLLACLEPLSSGWGESLYTAIQSTKPERVETFTALIINEINDHFPPFVLVLDDYHLISSPEIHRVISYLIDHQPEQMHIIIATRADPPLPLPRMRARGQLVEIREKDLRFTVEETEEFINQVMGLDLRKDQAAALERRTEGWAAGLQLAALSLKEQADKVQFLEQFTGSNRYIFDYLGQEVLAQLEPELREFLLLTSVLDRLNASLCEAVTSFPDCQEKLENLAARQLFVQAMDNDLIWYRYHRLFKEYLHKTLLVEMPGRDKELQLRASTWFQQQGLLEEAIDHALAAGSTAQVVQMITTVAFEKLMRSETSSLKRWIEALPDKVVQEHAVLCLIHAWTLMLRGGPMEQVEARLEIIEQATENDRYLGSVAAMRALMASINGQPQESLKYSKQAMILVPENDLFTRSLIFDNLGMVHLMFGDFDAAIDDFSLAVDLSQKAGNQMITVGGLCNMAGIWMLQGQLKRAWDANLQALERATDNTGRRLPIAAKALLGLGEIAREWNDLQRAAAYYQEGLELFQSYGELGSILSYVSLARIHEILGDYPAAQEVVNLARELARDFTASQMDDELVESYQVQLWLVMGEKNRAERWVEEMNLKELVGRNPPAGYFDPVWEVGCQTLARLYMSRGEFQAAREVIEPVLAAAESAHRMRSVIRYLAVLSVLLYQQEEKEGALETILQALDLAQEEGYVRTFLDEGQPMERLLYIAAEHDVHPAYVGRLLKEFGSEPAIKKPGEDISNMVEPLSRRELDVLELLSSGKSNQEIAGILHISLSTVKGHTSNIYGKLNVRNRTQAVSRGRELGIIAEN